MLYPDADTKHESVFKQMQRQWNTLLVLCIQPEPMADKSYRLPDLLRDWPWKRVISPHYRAVKAKSVPWIESFKPFSTKAQEAFNKCDFSMATPLSR